MYAILTESNYEHIGGTASGLPRSTPKHVIRREAKAVHTEWIDALGEALELGGGVYIVDMLSREGHWVPEE